MYFNYPQDWPEATRQEHQTSELRQNMQLPSEKPDLLSEIKKENGNGKVRGILTFDQDFLV